MRVEHFVEGYVDPALRDSRIVEAPSGDCAEEVRSRLVVLTDGTTMPVLRVLAREAGLVWDDAKERPEWRDPNARPLEIRENVHIVALRTEPFIRRSAYGVKSGTAAYRKAWRGAHPESVRRYAKASYERRKELIAKGRQLAEIERGLEGKDLVEDLKDPVLSKLESLIDGTDA